METRAATSRQIRVESSDGRIITVDIEAASQKPTTHAMMAASDLGFKAMGQLMRFFDAKTGEEIFARC